MSRVMKTVPLILLFTLIIAVPSVWAYWVQDGVALCTATGDQQYPVIVSDGAGGTIVAWFDSRSGNNDIYAQRVNASGAVQWAVNGVALCTATGNQQSLEITSAGAGGAIVTWQDYRSGSNYDIYAQRVNASGAVQWPIDGVAICTAAGNQQFPQISSDGLGGALVTWQDQRSGNWHAYAQRVNASGAVQWAADGVALCGTALDQDYPMIISDGAGGAIVTWYDYRNGNTDIYAQRVNASGAIQWTANGTALCTVTGNQSSPTIIGDGAGGAIVTWWDYRSGNWDIYAQRVNASGAIQWTIDGVALCTATGSQDNPAITSDEANGAIVTWRDKRSGSNYDIYAQRVNASGAIQWTIDGVALCIATGDQQAPTIVSAGAGGAFVTWYDGRSGGNNDIYAQYVNAYGMAGFQAPRILSVQDVPHDQGGWVRITIERSSLDDQLETVRPVSTYNVWQRIKDPALLAVVATGSSGAAPEARTNEAPLKHSVDASSVSGWPVRELNGRYFVQSKDLLEAGAFPAGTWELLGSFAAYQQNQYVYLASTVADSAASGVPYSVYVVSAHTTTPSVWFASDPDSGYSVDNIPPEALEGLMAEQSYTPAGLALSWNVSAANDLSHYAVYRSTTEGFVPGPGNRVATPTKPEYFDGAWRWSSSYYYKVSAVDVHDNQSGFALLKPDDVTGTDTPKAPAASYLAQNYPNPFNPTTRIEFGLSAPGHVSLRIYDASGRLVRMLADGNRPAANYSEVWDGKDAGGRAVASGIYFCRLDAGSFSQTRKMILLR